MRLVWTQFELDDRDAIFSYIESENPRAAVHVDEEITRAVRRPLDFPESGRPGRVEGTRELVIPRKPCIVAYMVTADRIPHSARPGAQIWPFEFGDE
ncbi:type II toxin-antitoxin system RelE/ParE family toxin [Ensifer adhaerens]|uniref:type II toxin-antitoxin system RelE/ParE family toxin n=1 Tax=Ensifer canadensis TaxID=555315 RepID=UPI00148FE99F|nr:type II toxin-antitoxin system RelE/ParE family toxin [Ensifer canadensis]NOV21549.1 type II toxin-antitoxin system RelE/ParE family toxin [Ensifer canadensis]